MENILRLPKRWALLLEKFSFLLLVAFFVQRLLYRFHLWHDSDNYITAANNFVKHGTLFIYSNWPSWNMLPATELYADFPPGYPLYLSIFIFFIKDLMLALAVAQSVALVAMYLAIYRVTVLLEISPLLRLTLLFFVSIFQPHRDPLQGLLTEPLYLALSIAALSCALDILKNGESTKKWFVACFFVFCASAVRWNGFACAATLLIPLFKYRKNFFYKAAAILATGVLPISLWFLRNYLWMGRFSTFYQKPRFLWDRLDTPFIASVHWWGYGSALFALAVLVFSLSPFFWKKLRERSNRMAYLTVVFGWITQFLIIYGLSLITAGMTPVDDRYLMPTYFLFTIALFYAAHLFLQTYRLEKFSALAALLCALAFTPKVIHHVKEHKLEGIGSWTLPPEKSMWEKIKTKEYFKNATHFYTDVNPIHQIFAQIPQRILRDGTPEAKPEQIRQYFSTYKNSFFVFTNGAPLLEIFEREVAPKISRLQKDSHDGYTIYFKE